jgi:hypothetical protein
MSFDISRLPRSDRIVGVGAIALFIFLFFFKWYGYTSNAPSIAGVGISSSYSIDGWHSFTNSRWIWLITIVVALGAVALSAGALKLRSPVQAGVIVAGLGALSTLTILFRIVHHPTASASFGGFHVSIGIKIGIWLGLVAAALITYGGYLAMRDEGTSLADVRDQASGALSNFTVGGGEGSSSAAAAHGDAAASPITTATAEPVAPLVPSSAPEPPDAAPA